MTPERLAEWTELRDCLKKSIPFEPETIAIDELLTHIEAQAKQIEQLEKDKKRLEYSVNDFHTPRWNSLQKFQKQIPEPYRTLVCDILANGKIDWVVRSDLREAIDNANNDKGA